MALYTKIKGDVNYVEIGSPTILDGVISGFSTSNYLKLPTFAPGNKSWELKLKFLSNNAGTTQAIVRLNTGTGDYGGMLIGMNGNNRLWWNIGSSGTSWFQTNPTIDPVLTDNTWYEILVKYDGSKYTLSMINNGVATVAYTNNTATPIYQQGDTTIGARVTGTTNYFRGSVDLNNTYIKIENTVWFGTSFSKVKVRTGLTKYTKVGNLIDNNGVISGFTSSSTYVYFNSPFNTNSNFEILLKLNTGNMTDNFRAIIRNSYGSDPGSGGFAIGIAANGSNKYIRSYLTYEDGTLFANGIWGQTAFQNNIDFLFKFSCINNILKIETSLDDGITWIIENSWNMTQNLRYSGQGIALGGGYLSIATQWWSGSIDIGKSYIKVDNGYYWRGSHQNINTWKIQQDNFSKYYTIVDGKLMWANPNTYLEGTGTQYIDTGFKADQNTRVVCKFSCNNTSLTQFIFGSRTSYNSNEFSFGIVDQVFRDTWRTSYTATSVYPSINKIYTIDKNKSITYLNNEVLVNNTMNSFNSANNLLLFAVPNSNGPSFYYNGKIFNSQIYDNGILIHHFVPVPKGLLIGNFVVPSNGMFDIVEQKFYGNAGTEDFVIGGIPEDYIIEGGKLIWCNPNIYLENPPNYQEYINTTIIPTNDMRFRVIAQLTDTTNEYDGCLFGSRKDSSATGKQFCVWNFKTSGNIGSFIYGDKWYGNYPGIAGQKYTFEYDGINYTINGTSPSTGVWIGDKNINSTLPIFLFGLNQNGSIESRRMRGKVFEFILWSNSTILQYLIPVPKGMLIGDKIAPSNCMFDMVTQTFFENQGTGNFIIGGLSGDYINVGDNIVWTDENVYLQSSGTQYIDTGFKANQDTSIRLSYTPLTVSGNRGIYSSRDTSIINTFTLFTINTAFRYDYNTTLQSVSGAVSSNIKKLLLTDKNKFYVDGTLKNTLTYASFQCNYSLLFFCTYIAASSANGVENFNNMKLYFSEVRDNSKLVRYFLPVNTGTVIDSFTVPAPGMWDAVTKKFYPNKGAGAFTYGKDS